MRRVLAAIALAGLLAVPAEAKVRRSAPAVPHAFEDEVTRHAKEHGVPETLVHRVILRESRYNPGLVSKRGHYGLMQISYGTARSMGYRGTPAGLLDPETNLTYAVPYLANAYRAAGNSESGAVRLYSSGYYYTAKKQGLLPGLRTAGSPSLYKPELVAAPAPPPEDDNPFLRLFRSAEPVAAAEQPETPAQP